MSTLRLLLQASLFLVLTILSTTVSALPKNKIYFTNNTNQSLSLVTSTLNDTEGGYTKFNQIVSPHKAKVKAAEFSRHERSTGQYLLTIDRMNSSLEPLKFRITAERQFYVPKAFKLEIQLPNGQYQRIAKDSGVDSLKRIIWGNQYVIYVRHSRDPALVGPTDFEIAIDAIAKLPAKTTNTLSVLTYNTQLMPFYAGCMSSDPISLAICRLWTPNNLNQPSKRVDLIADVASQFDLVVMQELFDGDLRQAMIDAMKQRGYYATDVVGDGIPRPKIDFADLETLLSDPSAICTSDEKFLTGGVVIFSRFPIIESHSMVYQQSAKEDACAAKGAMLVTIDKGGRRYHLVGTHMQAGSDDAEREQARVDQLNALKQFVDTFNIPSDEPILYAGDFNIDLLSDEYDELESILNVALPENTGFEYSADGATNLMTSDAKARQRLDYVFYDQYHLNPSQSSNHVFVPRAFNDKDMWPNYEISDHYPVAAYFQFDE